MIIRFAGWSLQISNPIEVHRLPAPNWQCQSCGRVMRFSQTNDRGCCGRCGGIVRRQINEGR